MSQLCQSLEPGAVRADTDEDRRPHVRVEDDLPTPCFAIDKCFVRSGRRIDRERDGPDVHGPSLAQIARLCIDGTAKFPSFLVPTIEAQLARGGPFECSALELAAWSRYLATVHAEQRVPDSRGDRATELATDAMQAPSTFLELDEVFTAPLRESRIFRDVFVAACRSLDRDGPIGAIQSLLRG
jgi:hypothetical protein